MFKLSPSAAIEAKRDILVFLACFVSVLDVTGVTKAAVIAALVAAVKVTARAMFKHATDEDASMSDDGTASAGAETPEA